MNGRLCHLDIGSWLLRTTLLLSMYPLATQVVAEPAKQVQTVQQRLTLASHLIERMRGAEKMAFVGELEELQTRFLVDVDEALANDTNTFFQRVVARYRESVPKVAVADAEVHEKRYLTKLAEVSAFRDSFEALVSERGSEARAVLNDVKLAERIARARTLAEKGAFSEAYSLVDGANHLLIGALQVLRDKETVEYRLEFSSSVEEYEYENRRFESQKMLLDMVVAENEPSQNSMLLINEFIAVAIDKMREAKGLAELGRVDQAIEYQEQAVEALTKAMRVAGVYF